MIPSPSAVRLLFLAMCRAVPLVLGTMVAPSAAITAQPVGPETTTAREWKRMPVAPGVPVTTRPFPPRDGRNRCVSVEGLAGAQLFGDRAIELSLKNGQRYRLFLAQECPALSFYQGFYYRRQRAGQLCAGRDVVGARSGGECPIASIIRVRPVGVKSSPKRKKAHR